MCYLRGDCRPGDSGEPTFDKDGPVAIHEKQEKATGLIWGRLLIQKNTIWSPVRFVREKVNCPKTLMVLKFAHDVQALDSL